MKHVTITIVGVLLFAHTCMAEQTTDASREEKIIELQKRVLTLETIMLDQSKRIDRLTKLVEQNLQTWRQPQSRPRRKAEAKESEPDTPADGCTHDDCFLRQPLKTGHRGRLKQAIIYRILDDTNMVVDATFGKRLKRKVWISGVPTGVFARYRNKYGDGQITRWGVARVDIAHEEGMQFDYNCQIEYEAVGKKIYYDDSGRAKKIMELRPTADMDKITEYLARDAEIGARKQMEAAEKLARKVAKKEARDAALRDRQQAKYDRRQAVGEYNAAKRQEAEKRSQDVNAVLKRNARSRARSSR